MSGTVTKYGDIGDRTGGRAVAKLLCRGQHLMLLERFGQIDPQPRNKTKTVKWRRYNSLARASAPLAEGVPPVGQKLTATDVVATLEEYGDLSTITNVIKNTHEDPVLMEQMDLAGEQAAETIEEMRINHLKAGTNVFYANGVSTRGTVNSPLTLSDIRKIYRYFMKHKARKISKIVKASAKVGTEAVAPAFYALGHTDCDADIRAIAGFVPFEHYSNSGAAIEGEIGKVENMRFVLSAMFDPWEAAGASGTTYLSGGVEVASSAAADVYPMLFIAKDAYGIVPLQGLDSIDISVINPNTKTPSNPLGQKGSVGWITMQTAAILNQDWLIRSEIAVTANPS